MRILLIHAEKFSYEAKQKALAKAEELTEENRRYFGENVLVAFTTVEEGDYDNAASIVRRATKEMM